VGRVDYSLRTCVCSCGYYFVLSASVCNDQARDRREQHAELTPFAQGDIVAGSKLTNIIKLQSSRDQQVPPPVMPAVCAAHRSETVSDLCDQCRQRGFGEPSVSQAMRAVPRMGTRLGPRPVRTASVDTCTCQLDRLRGVCDAEWRWPVGRTSLSDSEKSVGTTTLTDVKFRRTWSSDGDAPAVAVGGSSSSSSSSGPLASEMCANDNACLGTTEAERQSGSSLHGGSSTAARRMAYEQFAHVMYTNRANLQHTIAVQQRLFQQQLSDRALTDHALRGYINASPLGPPPLPPRKTHAEQQRGRGERSDGQQLHEWVVRRRADGTRYITRRTASPRHNSRQLTSSSSQEHQHRQALSGKTDVGRRKEAKDAGTEAPERTKKHDRPVNGKSAPTFPVMPSLRQAHQHPILAVITI